MAVLTSQARRTLVRTLRAGSVLLMIWFLVILFRSEESMTGSPSWLIFLAAVLLNLIALTVNPTAATTRVATDK